MTVTLKDRTALADFLDYVAELVRQGKIEGLSIAMAKGGARVSVEFAPGAEETLPGGQDLSEEDTKPGIQFDPKGDED
jgi:hypothetical protein